ncbi:DEAD/DEAH box helicase [Microvirga alba]|uniref:DEAD/DEAH box helicase n=1 Tax=Microvirga alba TaxID=2791025 RepID=A0A931FRA7_9HYPH|nr:DEAD/DEAH box helicase [Microvirga alba]MBF9235552.1 DEAD/DEAH box helicase [Microvirga alba]
MSVQLRDYQVDVIQGARAALRRSRRVLLQLPTGGGKTALASFMAGETAGKGRPVFFICHRAELVNQTSFTFRKFGIPHGFVAAGLPMDVRQPVQVCSIDTLKNRLHQLPDPALLIWDECHHLAAAGWQKVQNHYGSAFHIGLSATPCRLDGKGLDAHFDELVTGPTVAWLIEHGHLSPYRAFAPSAPDMTGVRKQMGDFVRGETERAMDKPKLTGDAITHWLKHANGMRSVGFAVTVAHSMHMAEQFNAAGIPSAHLDGGTPKADRARIIRDYADGRILVLFNVDLFGEGFDLSAIAQRDVTIDCVLQMRPTQSLGLHLQQVGRALRPSPGKTAIILDHAGNIRRHGLPDDEREWSLEGNQGKGRKAANDNEPPPPITCTGCFAQIRRPAPPVCPYCGHHIAPEPKKIEVAEGELQEITDSEKAAIRANLKREQAEAKSLQELVALGARRGYKSPQQWAFRVWSGRKHRAA